MLVGGEVDELAGEEGPLGREVAEEEGGNPCTLGSRTLPCTLSSDSFHVHPHIVVVLVGLSQTLFLVPLYLSSMYLLV